MLTAALFGAPYAVLVALCVAGDMRRRRRVAAPVVLEGER